MQVSQFTENPIVLRLLEELRQEGIYQKQFSDVLDDQGNQYVDLVQEGGGMLGIALTGYVYILEQVGIRFMGLAGTSAGAINTILMASLGKIQEAKSHKVLHYLANKNFFEFVDGDEDVINFIKLSVSKPKEVGFFWKFKYAWFAYQIADTIREHIGMNPGINFLTWLIEILEENGIKTLKDLKKLRAQLPDSLHIRDGVENTIDGLEARLVMIAADITTQTKIEFPRMACLYWDNPDEVNPAYFARASMSVPVFFYPLRLNNLPRNEEAKQRWSELAGYRGEIPQEVVLVDGGIVSNFPINVFHKTNAVPRLPTFGVKLGIDRTESTTIKGIRSLFGASFDTARHIHDFDFIFRNPEYRQLVAHIDTGEHHWLNFAMSDYAKVDLFVRGAKAAADFLKRFDWQKYKEYRRQLKVT
ncbi:MAG: patatin-like phospholipase family protein [Cytophagales bacterium]|nr:patatin-like phospholipase family protein [Cytophagales bacterium]MDW8383565.1 patatin-like phospholipase family protein [Flammeovirgaceae bacterium]